MNTHLLMCAPRHFRVDYEINPYMRTGIQPDRAVAVAEHAVMDITQLRKGGGGVRCTALTVDALPAVDSL